ncbi:MAG: hypothetical protein GY717_00805 [Rhodobacteraceae bacterium]|nr:hypothetical protein [Paracoccaceae bacterium]
MVDLAGIPPFGGGGVNVRPVNDAPASAVPAVEAAGAGQGLAGRMDSERSQTGSGQGWQQAPQPGIVQETDPHALPGPPPTFQISLLEMDRDLSQMLARINATHAIASDAAAIAGPAEGPDRADTAGPGPDHNDATDARDTARSERVGAETQAHADETAQARAEQASPGVAAQSNAPDPYSAA